jgi:mannosyl-3-phosphoglycerate phosphatase
MGKRAEIGNPVSPQYIVFTDLDGTLLDENTYDWDEALPALELCRQLRIPIVLVSSKTRAEIEVIHHRLALSAPFVSENGGGIFFPGKENKPPYSTAVFDKGFWKLSLGVPYPALIRELRAIEYELGLDLRGFSDMEIEEISALTGLDTEASQRAALREFDEPFIIHADDAFEKETLYNLAAGKGLVITEGGRFFHLQGKNDKGQAVEKIIGLLEKDSREIFTIGLGDSPNDFSMLRKVNRPFLVRSKRNYPGIKDDIRGIIITEEKGPAGWNTALLNTLKNIEEDEGHARGLPKRT